MKEKVIDYNDVTPAEANELIKKYKIAEFEEDVLIHVLDLGQVCRGIYANVDVWSVRRVEEVEVKITKWKTF